MRLYLPGPVALIVALVAFSDLARAQNAPGKKYAFLVGVNEYEHPKLPNLRFAVNDVTVLAEVLTTAGYEVITLRDRANARLQPTRANIEQQLQAVLARCRRSDTLLLGFAGHGLQFTGERDAFFCPRDAIPFATRKESLMSLQQVYQQLEESRAGIKLLLVDACRDDPDANRGTRGIGGGAGPLVPAGVAALFSCRAGQRAFEHEKLGHGVFFHAVLQGLKGEAAHDGKVNWDDLVAHVRRKVPATVKQLLRDEDANQLPTVTATELDVVPVLVQIGATTGFTFEKQTWDRLRGIINQGAELFNDRKDYEGCKQLYQQELIALRPLLGKYPQLQQAIDEGLAKAAKEKPVESAFTLRGRLDTIRSTLKKALDQK